MRIFSNLLLLSLFIHVHSIGSKIFKVVYQNLTWYEAREYCMTLKGQLAVIESKGEEKDIVALTRQRNQSSSFHIGYQAIFDDDFLDVYGKSAVYLNWNKKKPLMLYTHMSDKLCSIFNPSGKISDWYCHYKSPFICEIKPVENKKCNCKFIINKSKLTWIEARRHCYNLGGHLATIETMQKLNEAINLARSQNVFWLWIGYHNQFHPNHIAAITGDNCQSHALKWDLLKNPGFGAMHYSGKTKIYTDTYHRMASLCEVRSIM